MADDHYSRPPRPSNPLARPQSARRAPPSGGDPLAELARLIGQSDPYAGFTQTPSSAGSTGRHAHDARSEESGWRGTAEAYPPRHDPYAQHPNHQDGYGANAPSNPPYSDQAYTPPHAPAQGYSDPHYGDHGYSDQNYSDQNYNEPYYGDQNYAGGAADQDERYAPDGYAPQSYPPQAYGDPQYPERAHDARFAAAQPDVPQFASPQYDDKPYPAYDNQLYAAQAPAFPPALGDPHAAHRHAAPNEQGYPGAYDNDPNSPAYGAPYYQHEAAPEIEETPARRRGGLVTVLAVLALAVVGTAAAFGYRAVFAPAGTRVPPPVIKADTTPSKIVPANDAAKPIQDRVGDRAQIERIINREEQPVDVNTARAGTPRVVFPGPNPIAPLPNSPIPQSPTAQAPTLTGSAPAASTEPKKVRTVTIRSDQPDLAAAANATAAATSAPRTSAPSGVLPEDDQRNAARAQASASSGPLSLSPGTVQSAQRSAPMRTASAPAANGGGYSVQVTSQRSEGEAQAAFAALQAKFPSVLGNRQALIRRADLGEKGTYYRAQIPFGSQGDAADFCTSLRSAGGQCVIQRN